MKYLSLLFFVLLSYGSNAQNLQWVKGLNSLFNTKLSSAVDSIGNTYSTSQFTGILDFDPGPGTYTVSPVCCNNNIYITKLDSLGDFEWVKTIGGRTQRIDVLDIDIDNSGNVMIVGYYKDTIDFDPSSGTYTMAPSATSNESSAFILKLDALGNFMSAWNFGGIGSAEAYAFDIDKNNNILISGLYYGSVDFDPGVATHLINGGRGMFIVKLNSSGNFLWVDTIGGTGTNSFLIEEITTDDFGNSYATGSFNQTIDFDPGTGINNLSALGNQSIFVLKLDAAGNFNWAKSIGGVNGINSGNAIALDSFGNAYIGGYFGGTVDFDPGTGVNNITSTGNNDGFILKLNNNGDFAWVKEYNSTFQMLLMSLLFDSNDNLYFGGKFKGTVDFMPGAGTYNLTTPPSPPPYWSDAFIAKLDPAGSLSWVQQIGSAPGSEVASCISHDKKNNIYVSGIGGDVVDFDTGTGVRTVPAADGPCFIFKLSACPASAYGISGYTAVCEGATTSYSVSPATDATGYIWSIPANSTINSGANTNSITMTYSASPGVIIVTPTNSCGVGPSSTLTVVFNAPLVITPATAIVCNGSSVTYSASGAATYSWSTGVNTPTINILPTISGTHTVTGTNILGCQSAQTVSVTVDNTCQDVWPGDANSDGVANNIDVLELGLHYSQTGAPRAATNNNWQSYFSNNWTGTITNGKNVNHSDCNGDGTIDDNDTLAIYNNYGLTHAFKTAQITVVNPQLSIVPDQTSVVKGTWGTASIYLGDASTNINNINGLAFTLDFDNTLIETNSIYIEYQNSFLDAGQNLKFRKQDFANGKIYTATTHTINNNVSGSGLIGILHYQIKSSLTTDTVLNLGITQAVHSDASGTIYSLTAGKSSVTILVTSVGLQETMNSNFISMVPNPTDGMLTINSKTELQKIEVLSITGQVLLSETPSNVSHTLHLDNFANGIYFVNVYQSNRIVKREKIVLNK